ncbi:DMT family transporter [Brucella anthropi]|jgi:DME family drug/metabolite transporter|uniref:EamA family transporter n=1 Tax=Brucella anthropi TaxID=529 RepID=A0A6I0DJV0_BRUAN|nr:MULTISPECIES: EamA family transporter [Brucella/Ochrobactrum group]MCR5942127.1 EamA family transporter [Ochrobactrum sp. XJ1]QTN05197.1 EamA family transporter [Ochrobactrum sp. EEELCW01]KAB2740103.1 EamA family transporter [Brucella anthropi]KAB2755818.1 EamA family transporter [Brucella anthropi]KAB2767327.1 EamA family transporter [Brucella anthropi]
MQSSKNYLLGVTAIIVASTIWGTTGTAATFAPEVGAAAIGAAAMGLGGLAQAAIAWRGLIASRKALADQWRVLLVGAVCVAIYPLAFYGSMRMAGVTIGTVISLGSAPLLSAGIEYRQSGFRPSLRWLAGAIIGIVGMVLLSMSEDGGGHTASAEGSALMGALVGLVAGFTYALYSSCARQLMQGGISSTTAMGATFGIGGLLLMPVLLATGGPFLASWNNAAVGLYMAFVPMFLGYVCFGYGLSRVETSVATTITLFEPVVAAFFAVVIVGERLSALGWFGVLLVVICLVCITIPTRSQKAPLEVPEPST